MVYKTTPSESLLVYVARIVIFTIIIFVAVLAVDVVILWLLSLDVDTWLMLLWWEGVAMAFFGGAGWWRGDKPLPISRLSDKRIYKLKVKFQYPWFWVSLGMAGFMLIILAVYLYLQFY